MASLLPMIKYKPTDANDQPIPGGKLWSYEAGTTTPTPVYTDSLGLVPHTNPVVLDANGEAVIWLRPGSYKFVLTDADDVVLDTQDQVRPADGGGGGITDADYVYEGYSARFGEQFGPSTGLQDTIARILNISYTPPSISLSASGSGTIREKGAEVSSTTLTATITKRSTAISEVRFYQGATLIETKSSPNPNGGTETYAYETPFDDNISFSARVDDTASGVDGPSTVTSNTVSFNFVYPYYVGSGAASLSAANVASLTKRVIASTSSRAETITVGDGEHTYFAYPASYGALTSILDENGFEVFSSWTLRTEDITGLDGTAQSYRIYEGNNPLSAGSYQFTFRR